MQLAGKAISVARRGGAIHTFDSLNHVYLIGQMIVVGSSYWNIGFGVEKGSRGDDGEIDRPILSSYSLDAKRAAGNPDERAWRDQEAVARMPAPPSLAPIEEDRQ